MLQGAEDSPGGMPKSLLSCSLCAAALNHPRDEPKLPCSGTAQDLWDWQQGLCFPQRSANSWGNRKPLVLQPGVRLTRAELQAAPGAGTFPRIWAGRTYQCWHSHGKWKGQKTVQNMSRAEHKWLKITNLTRKDSAPPPIRLLQPSAWISAHFSLAFVTEFASPALFALEFVYRSRCRGCDSTVTPQRCWLLLLPLSFSLLSIPGATARAGGAAGMFGDQGSESCTRRESSEVNSRCVHT